VAGLGAASAEAARFPGVLRVDVYADLSTGDNNLNVVTNSAKYIAKTPDRVEYVKWAEYPPGGDDGSAPPGNVYDGYGIEMWGWFKPPANGRYVFFVASDDPSTLYLSSNEDPANQKQVCFEPQWNEVRKWVSADRRPGCAGDELALTCEQRSEPIALVAGNKYYLRYIGKEGLGGDNFAITYILDGDPLPERGTEPALKADNIEAEGPDSITITAEPQDALQEAGKKTQFSFRFIGPPGTPTIKWTKNGATIAGADTTTLITDPVTLADNNARIQAEVSFPGLAPKKTREAILTVVAVIPTVDTACFLKFEAYAGIAGNPVQNLLDSPNFPDLVTETLFMTAFDSRTVYPDDSHEAYGARISGWITVPVNGNYTFHLRSDDASQLFVSPNATIPNPTADPITAEESGCCGPFEEPGATETSAEIALVAGTRYGVLALLKEGGGGDYIQVAIRKSDDTTAAASLKPIASAYLSTATPIKDGITVEFTEQVPAAIDVAENSSFTTKVAVNVTGASQICYQWQIDGVSIVGANSATFVSPPVTKAQNGKKVRCIVAIPGKGNTLSSEATLNVSDDRDPPSISKVDGSQTFTAVTVTYDEPMPASAETAGNYQISGGIAVTGATRVSDNVIRLATSKMAIDTAYTLTVNNVADRAGNPLTPNVANFRSFLLVKGIAQWEAYQGIGGNTLDALTTAPIYPDSPTTSRVVSLFEGPTGFDEAYGARIQALVEPLVDGDFVFYLSTDDNGGLFLSTDEDPGKAKQIAQEPTWNGVRDWTGTARRPGCADGTCENRSDQWVGTEWATGNKITLKKGTRYYLYALYKEGGGGDNGAVTATLAGGNPAGQAPLPVANVMDTYWYANPASGPPVLTKGITGGGVFDKGSTVAFSVDPGSILGEQPFSYQWQKNWVDIPGATGTSYSIPNADVNAIGDYRLVVKNAAAPAGVGSPEHRAIMSGGFLIEAEDYNSLGTTKDVLSTMPYTGGAMNGEPAQIGIDYNNGDANDSDLYRTTAKGGSDTAPTNVNMDNYGALQNRGAWDMTVNHKIGWVGAGEWQNYTRSIPAGTYNVVAALSFDGRAAGQLNASLSQVTSDPTKANQTVVDLGTFNAPGSGGWGPNDLIPMQSGGALGAVVLPGGPVTLRFNTSSGDFDYFWLYPGQGGGGGGATIGGIARAANGDVVIQFTGTLESAPAVNGPYTAVAGATPPSYQTTPSAAAAYFRSRSP
jgi:hypothetical protein